MMQTQMGHFVDIKVKASDLKPSVKQVKGRKPRKSQLWAKHDIDLDPSVYGKRLHTRGPVCSKVQYGMANDLDELDTNDFYTGVGLYVQVQRPGDWRIINVLSGETLGYAHCHEALAYRIAAARVGVTLEVYDA